MKNSGSIVLGIVAAATAGVIIGMLIAPEKGEDLRKSIRNKAMDWKKRFADLMAEGDEQLKELQSSFDQGVEGLKEDINGAKA